MVGPPSSPGKEARKLKRLWKLQSVPVGGRKRLMESERKGV